MSIPSIWLELFAIALIGLVAVDWYVWGITYRPSSRHSVPCCRGNDRLVRQPLRRSQRIAAACFGAKANHETAAQHCEDHTDDGFNKVA